MDAVTPIARRTYEVAKGSVDTALTGAECLRAGTDTVVYAAIGRRLAGMKLPTLICQEGGYNLEVLGECVRTFLGGFMAG